MNEPTFIAPMLANLATLPSDESQWAFEVKWDGMRAIGLSQPGDLRLISRTGNEVTTAFPELAGLSGALKRHSAVVDGEIVVFDESGRPSFQALQSRIHLRGEAAFERLADFEPVSYMLFDLLWLDGESLLDLPYEKRRERLTKLKLDGPRWHVPEFHRGDGAALLAATREQGLEGIVAKRLDSRYVPGRRVGWVKVKNSNRQEVVIGGWTTGRGSREKSIGALHLGVRDAGGDLRYVGRVGTGFNSDSLAELLALLAPLELDGSPFTGRQPPKGAHFVRPELVCEVEFSEWTHAGTLRQASYKGLRDDKPAGEVVRERAGAPPPATAAAPHGNGTRNGNANANANANSNHAHNGNGNGNGAGPGVSYIDIGALVAAGNPVRDGVEIELQDRTLKLTNLSKVLYPRSGFTKLDLIAYYAAVSPALLPQLHDRPLTLKRYPGGVEGKYFYEKRSPNHRPDWVQTVTVPSERGKSDIPFTLCQDLPTLVWLANLADIELHPSLSLAGELDCPTNLAFDLDPGPPANIVQCCAVALKLRALFDDLGLCAIVKTSGSKGLQVYVPLNDPDARYQQTKTFARAVAEKLEHDHPELVVSAMAKQKRTGKVLIDWSQNDVHKTTVSVYSLRATERPSVSTPISWDEVAACQAQNSPQLLTFTPGQVLGRISQHELFSQLLSTRQETPELKD